MAVTWTYVIGCFVLISLGLEITLVTARQNNPIVVPRGQRKNFVNDHLYFIGKRNEQRQASRSSETLDHQLRFTDEKISDALLQSQCFSDHHCPETHCCALFQSERPRSWSMGSFRHPMAQCVPLGYNGEMCFHKPSGSLGAGCGCARGLNCVTFAGYGFGICVDE